MNTQNKLTEFLSDIWNDFIQVNPTAKEIHSLLEKNNEKVVNDHIAFRTFSRPEISAKVMADRFTQLGYTIEKEYEFPVKRLKALHMEHFDISKPKIFISEIDINKLSNTSKKVLEDSLRQIPAGITTRDSLPFSGRHWEASYKTYLNLYSESEYAAWLYAHGFRANHFTVLANELKNLNDIKKLNEFLKANGFTLNASGGEIKGSPSLLLEQSSTMAAPVQVRFEEGLFNIPGGYYEFAKRYPMKNSKLFQGFVAESADKIFESTNRIQI
ncbi:MAG: 2-oxoadipate dioxygenase/decarboxylase family protein [Pseudobdellovibrio sp.]